MKAWLKSAHLTLDTMWFHIHSMLEGQHSKIRKELEQSRSRPWFTDRMFFLLQENVSIKAIEMMEAEIRRGIELGIGLERRCGCAFQTTHGLPCACKLIYMKNEGKRVHLSDVHEFWRTLEYDGNEAMPKNVNDMLEEIIEKAIKSDLTYKKVFLEKMRDILHPEDEDILPPAVRENPKGPLGAPLEMNFTIGLLSTWNKRFGVLEDLWGHIDGWVDVGNDGHCGYRVISHAQRGIESDYVQMRD
ncbi:hypothetical protein RND81_07G094900 [Saponaria officinalis]|uniref:Protein FAR1-RELATED SEQUENCE n=1 Tax=Saponaria officinalis TaxID=3572 RepID=A0AAW1JLN6_SAPOF